MSEILNTIWGYVLPIGGGITIGAVIIAIGTIVIKSAISKILSKIDVDQAENKAVEKGIEKVKSISFTQSIQPLVESELEKVCEKANKYIESSLSQVNTKLTNLGTCLSILASYFDSSIAVSDEKKSEMKKALATLSEKKIEVEQEIKVIENTYEETTDKQEDNTTSEINVER